MAEAIGIAIGNHSLDLVRVGGTGKAPRLLATSHLELEPPTAGAPSLTQPLRQLLQQGHLTTCQAQIGIAADTAIIRYFQMPKLPAGDRPAAVRFEAKKYLPFKLDELLSDFHIVILKSDPNVMRVMFYAAKKDLLTGYLQSLKETAIHPAGIETSLSALIRVLRRSRQLEPGNTTILLFAEQAAASIAVVRDEIVYLARNVTVLPPAGAPRADIYSALLNETVVSADYYRRRFAGEPAVAKAVVCGESVPAGWTTELGQALELPVETAEVGRGMSGGQTLKGNAAIAYGLALRGLEAGRGAINLLPVELRPKPKGMLQYIGMEVGAAALALVIAYQVMALPVRALTHQLATLPPPATTLRLAPADMTLDRLKHLQAEALGETRFLKSFLETRTSVAALLSDITTLTPDEVWFRRISYEEHLTMPNASSPLEVKRRLTIAGSSYSADQQKALDAVNRFVEALNHRATASRHLPPANLVGVQHSAIMQADALDFDVTSETKAAGRRP